VTAPVTTLTVNEIERAFHGDPAMPLLWYLRDLLGQTDTKRGCMTGSCKACAVRVDGQTVASCTIGVGDATGSRIATFAPYRSGGVAPLGLGIASACTRRSVLGGLGLAASGVLLGKFGLPPGAGTKLSDLRLPGQLYAVVSRPPIWGYRPVSFDAAQALSVGGVRRVFPVLDGIAVVADTTWSALVARDALAVTWSAGQVSRFSPYDMPNLDRPEQEFPGATAYAANGYCRIWSPTDGAVPSVAAALGLDPERIVHTRTAWTGGSPNPAYALEAAVISNRTGTPVNVAWTVADDIAARRFLDDREKTRDAGCDRGDPTSSR